MSTRCSRFETTKISKTDHYCRGGGRTKFDQWSECPLSTDWIHKKNRKRYPNVKSRYMEPAVQPIHKTCHGRELELQDPKKKCYMLKQERDRLASHNTLKVKRKAILSLAECMYLDMLEADGRLDELASALGHLIAVDDERIRQMRWSTTVPSIQLNVHLLNTVKTALFAGDSYLPSALLRTALAFINETHWLWVIEQCLMTALSLLANGGWHEATCLFVAGQFYATTESAVMHTNWTVSRPARFLERARRAADGHRRDWSLPADVLNAHWTRAVNDGGVWTSVCFAEHKILLEAAKTLDPDRALQAVQAASRLLKLCGADEQHRAVIQYELGVKYLAAGRPVETVEAFSQCADMVADQDSSDLHLEARLEAAQVFLKPRDAIVLNCVADEALKRHNKRLLVKAMTVQGRFDAYNDKPKKAYHRFALAYRLAVLVDDYTTICDINGENENNR